jgi:hypothetical protein
VQPEQPRVIRWHLEDEPKSGLKEKVTGSSVESVLSGAMRQQSPAELSDSAPIAEIAEIVEIFGMHWGAAAQFQNLLSESGVLEAS